MDTSLCIDPTIIYTVFSTLKVSISIINQFLRQRITVHIILEFTNIAGGESRANSFNIQDLDIETRDTRGHWQRVDELLEVVTFHLPRYEQTVKSCQNVPGQANPS